MPIDPATGFPVTPDARRADKLAELERRVAALERGNPSVQVLAAAPTSAPRDGTLAATVDTSRLWLRINGAWRWTATS